MKLQIVTKYLIRSMILIGLLFPLPATALEGFRARVDYLDNSKFPQVDAYISVSDANGLPIKNLKQDAFVLTEDGSPIAAQAFQAVQNKEQPLSIVLIMDTSGSMRGKGSPTPMQKSMEAAIAFVGKLSPKDRVAIINFSDKPNEILPLTEDKARVTQAIQSLQPEGQYTSLYDAVIKGLNSLESQSGRRIIVLITDGKDTGRGVFKSDDAMRELSAASIPIYPMGFGQVNAVELKKMAELTGGSAKILPSVSELSKSFDEVLSSLREQYLIRYTSSFPADDKQHELLATVSYGGGQEKTTYLFIAKQSSIPITLPDLQPNQVVGGLVKFSPVIDWPPALIKSVDISVDGAQIPIAKSADGSYEWNSFNSGLTADTHNFLVKVTDVGGNTGQASVALNVQPPITIEVVSPQDGASLSGTVQIKARVTALDGVALSRVAFMVDNREVASVPADSNTNEYSADWKPNESRQYPVRIIAYDAAGLFTTETETIFVNVEPGGLGGVVVIFILALAALVIPLALLSRKRKGIAAAASGKPSLYELEGMNPNQVWRLGATETKLGRKREENDIPLKGLNASRRHAAIRFEQGQYFIYSLSAENPVIVNNIPVAQKQALMRGDVIRLGETVLRFDS
ncbi:MAG: VWA domain-containing protein [Anaerolineales bacterium]|nr:VWA domain-containing protein [Anaerolineales bacterium]